MFRDLSTLNKFSWASAALVCLYDNLNDASMFTTHALAGYPTLLQVTIVLSEIMILIYCMNMFCFSENHDSNILYLFLLFWNSVGFMSISPPLVDVESLYTVVMTWVILELCGGYISRGRRSFLLIDLSWMH
jgi:hypothetical protein